MTASNATENPQNRIEAWRWGRFSFTLWSCLIYVAIIFAFAIPRLFAGSDGRISFFPLYGPAEYVQGSYPSFWLVYCCIPLLVRDVYVARKNGVPLAREFKIAVWSMALITAAAFHFVFGWY